MYVKELDREIQFPNGHNIDKRKKKDNQERKQRAVLREPGPSSWVCPERGGGGNCLQERGWMGWRRKQNVAAKEKNSFQRTTENARSCQNNPPSAISLLQIPPVTKNTSSPRIRTSFKKFTTCINNSFYT